MTYEDLLAEYVAVGAEKQHLLTDLIGDRDWQADLEGGTIVFGDDIEAETQALGSEDERIGTWMWAWANESWGLPTEAVEVSLAVRRRGEKLGVPELVERDWPLDEVRNGHGFALISCGLLDLPAYYRGPAGDGAAMLVVNHPDLVLGPPNALRAVNVLTESIGAFELDHRAVLAGYCKHRSIASADVGDEVVLNFGDGQVARIAFDHLGRIAGMETTLN